ncbi:MAG: hypothetical protein Q9160_007588 [Pyrenula sp. 1 TL-2023]
MDSKVNRDGDSSPMTEPETCKALCQAIDHDIRGGQLSQAHDQLSDWYSAAISAGCERYYIQETLKSFLYDAARFDRSSLIAHLLSRGAEFDGYTSNIAIKSGSTQSLQIFLEQQVWSPNFSSPAHATPITGAIRARNASLVYWLLDRGADPNLRSHDGSKMDILAKKTVIGTPLSLRPLDIAAASHQVEMFDLLLSRGARIEECNALHSVCGDPRVRDAEAREISQSATRIIDFLLAKGMAIHVIELENDDEFLSKYGERCRGTPLHYAAKWGNTTIASHLIDRGARRDAKDSEGSSTPLDWATQYSKETGWPVEVDLVNLLS